MDKNTIEIQILQEGGYSDETSAAILGDLQSYFRSKAQMDDFKYLSNAELKLENGTLSIANPDNIHNQRRIIDEIQKDHGSVTAGMIATALREALAHVLKIEDLPELQRDAQRETITADDIRAAVQKSRIPLRRVYQWFGFSKQPRADAQSTLNSIVPDVEHAKYNGDPGYVEVLLAGVAGHIRNQTQDIRSKIARTVEYEKAARSLMRYGSITLPIDSNSSMSLELFVRSGDRLYKVILSCSGRHIIITEYEEYGDDFNELQTTESSVLDKRGEGVLNLQAVKLPDGLHITQQESNYRITPCAVVQILILATPQNLKQCGGTGEAHDDDPSI